MTPSQQPPKRLTLQAIAEEAGVDVSTVSRVLNSAPGEETRWASARIIERIKTIATEGGYRKNRQAAGLRTNRSQSVGVIVPRLQDFVLATVFEGIEDAAGRSGFSAFVANSLDSPTVQSQRVNQLLSHQVDGLILGDTHFGAPVLTDLQARGIPFVLVSRHAGTNFLSATCDDSAGGSLAAQHLIDTGRSNFAVLPGQEFASTARDRLQGFRSTCTENGIEIDDAQVAFGPFDASGGRMAMQEIFERGIKVDAVFAANDFAAIGAMGVIQEHGLSVPDDIAVVGYNNTPLASELTVPLTTINSPMHEMGKIAFGLLSQLLADEQPSSVRLVPQLIKRASTSS